MISTAGWKLQRESSGTCREKGQTRNGDDWTLSGIIWRNRTRIRKRTFVKGWLSGYYEPVKPTSSQRVLLTVHILCHHPHSGGNIKRSWTFGGRMDEKITHSTSSSCHYRFVSNRNHERETNKWCWIEVKLRGMIGNWMNDVLVIDDDDDDKKNKMVN